MFDSLREHLEEYTDYFTDANETIKSGIDAMKGIFSGVVNKYNSR